MKAARIVPVFLASALLLSAGCAPRLTPAIPFPGRWPGTPGHAGDIDRVGIEQPSGSFSIPSAAPCSPSGTTVSSPKCIRTGRPFSGRLWRETWKASRSTRRPASSISSSRALTSSLSSTRRSGRSCAASRSTVISGAIPSSSRSRGPLRRRRRSHRLGARSEPARGRDFLYRQPVGPARHPRG